MNIGWLRILAAVICELVWVTGLKYANLPWEWGITVFGLVGSTYFLITAGNTLPVGTAYSVFVGLGSVGTILIELLVFNVVPSLLQVIFIAMLVAGIIGLKLLNEQKYKVGEK